MKKLIKIVLIILLVIILLAVCFLGWLTIQEFKPDDVEKAKLKNDVVGKQVPVNANLEVVSWNIGYGGLGEEMDCFMDGGSDVKPDSLEMVENNIEKIGEYIDKEKPDFTMYQEIDAGSSRNYNVDEINILSRNNTAYAQNFLCKFVPYPVPPIGRVDSGIFTTTSYEIESSDRISLPCPFTWPIRTANLKRCLLVSYLPIENSDKKLVLVNLHLEAYDDGEGKIAQTKMLSEFIKKEYEKGNYVVAGGDFNQTFAGCMDTYPIEKEGYWVPAVLDNTYLPDGWEFTYDLTNPTCRLLNHPYNKEDKEFTQHYILDGFIMSPNVQINSVESVDLGFVNSDHNPVKVNFTLK